MKINLFLVHLTFLNQTLYMISRKNVIKNSKKGRENTKNLPKYKREYTIHVLTFRVQNEACLTFLVQNDACFTIQSTE